MNQNERNNRRGFAVYPTIVEEPEEPVINNPFLRIFFRIVELVLFQLYLIYWVPREICIILFKRSEKLFSMMFVHPMRFIFPQIIAVINYIRFRVTLRPFLSVYKLLVLTGFLFLFNAKYIQPELQDSTTVTSGTSFFANGIHATENDFDIAQSLNLNSLGKVINIIKSMDEGNKKVWEKVAEEAKEVKTTISTVKTYFEDKINKLWGRIGEQQRQIESVEKEVFLQLDKRQSEFENEQEERLINIQKNLYRDIEDTVQRYLSSSGVVVPDVEDQESSLSIQHLVESITSSVLEKEGKPDIKLLEDMIDKYIQKYHQDVLNSADFALKKRGAYILHSKTSSTFDGSSVWKRAFLMLIGISLPPATTPEMAISPGIQINDCWSMFGDKGTLGISLSEPIYIHGITVEHPSKEILLNQIRNAPKEMEIYGIHIPPSGIGKEQLLLGSIFYDINGEKTKLPIQSFDLRDPSTINRVFVAVEIKILSNWGNSEQTDIYRIRIHGAPPPIKQIDY